MSMTTLALHSTRSSEERPLTRPSAGTPLRGRGRAGLSLTVREETRSYGFLSMEWKNHSVNFLS